MGCLAVVFIAGTLVAVAADAKDKDEKKDAQTHTIKVEHKG